MDVVRLNTKVVRVAMAQPPPPPPDGARDSLDMRWLVSGEILDLDREWGNAQWRRRQLHSHSYRVPDSFRDEVMIMVGCGDSGMDIALDLCGVAKAVHITAKSVEQATTPAMSKMLANHADLHLHPQVERLCENGTVAFADGTRVAADAVIYCTGYKYSFPFLNTGGAVTVDDDCVGPLFEHTFPPALAPSLSFVGIQRKLLVPWSFEAQGGWIAQVLSGKCTLSPADEMLRAVEEYCRAREAAGVPAKYTHHIGSVSPNEMFEFLLKYTDLPPREEWKRELTGAFLRDMNDDHENFRDLDNDSESVREGVQRWLCLSDAPHQAVPGSCALVLLRKCACHFQLPPNSEVWIKQHWSSVRRILSGDVGF
ncbi:hypothetical protein EJB05_13709, partial [Eragrostis curvula]